MGPARYDIAQRVWNVTGSGSLTLRMTKVRLGSAEMVAPRAVTSTFPLAFRRPSSSRCLSRSVCSLPMNQVPAFDSPL